MITVDRDTRAETEQRGHDGQPHRDDRTERDEQDDHGGQESERFALRHLELGEHVAAVLDRQALDVDLVAQILDLGSEIDRVLILEIGHLELGERDRRGLADLVRALGGVRARDVDVIEVVDAREQVFHRAADLGIVDALRRLEHDLPGEARAIRACRGQLVLDLLRLTVGKRHVGAVVRSEDPVGHDVRDEEDADPADEDEHAAADGETGDALEHEETGRFLRNQLRGDFDR